MKLDKTYQLALKAAIDASNILVEYCERGFQAHNKADGSPVTEADLASSKHIRAVLEGGGIPIVDEESAYPDLSTRASWEQNWCVDPLDGTKEFIKGNGEFAVNIALIEEQKPIFGVITHPMKKLLLFGGKAMGVHLLHFSEIDSPDLWKTIHRKNAIENHSIISSRSHLSGKTAHFVDQIEQQTGNWQKINKGSALKFIDLALENAQLYPRFAPTMEWDVAAGQAILNELGGKVINAETGEELIYNKENLLNPHFIAVSPAFQKSFEKLVW
ncbi:MAG: 3'(2'),5'-bisphosphate nucleotidase CysQ [Bacteroidetes bacterium]|nr:MAG: 3'(2'),5'-bisphosphate nucleotidase CysQ [Bacteroidota bacterium]